MSLIEVVVAVGVLAVAVPLGLAAMAKAGMSGVAARAETRAPAMAERCLLELREARRGRSEFFPPLAAGVGFPADGEVLALVFAADGRVIGAVGAADYESGLAELDGRTVDYVAAISGDRRDGAVTVEVAVEYPVVRRAADRSAIEFHTRLP